MKKQERLLVITILFIIEVTEKDLVTAAGDHVIDTY